MTTLTFKTPAPEDWEKIQSIAHLTWWQTYSKLLPPEQIEYMLELIYSEDALKNQMRRHEFLLAYERDELSGFTSFEPKFNNSNLLMIHKLYLLPEMQGRGIGKQIIHFLESRALRDGQDALRLKVFHKNTEAQKFYDYLGFKISGTEESDIGRGYVILDLVMVKQLTPHTSMLK